MRIIITILVMVGLVTTGQSQISQKENGLYYNQEGELYTGTYIEYYPNGNKRVEMTVVEGKKDGVSKYYFEDNKIQEKRSYKENQMHGLWETWSNEGVKLGVANYKQGKKHGKWFIYNEKGVMLYDMEYENGSKAGEWKSFDEKGNLKSKKKY